MTVIENFAELSAQEQHEFAEKLIDTINSESTFSSDTNFEIVKVEVDDTTGDLYIEVSHTDLIEVPREATWTCPIYEEESVDSDPGYDADYADHIYNDIETAFKTLTAEIEGYQIELAIGDVDEVDTVEVKVDHASRQDAGIGRYEFWGDVGYDSRPYIEVEGTIIKACECLLAFYVSPAAKPIEVTSEDSEEEI